MAKEKRKSVRKSVITKEIPANTNVMPPAKQRRLNTLQLSIPKLPLKSGFLLVCGQNDVGQLGLNPDDVMEKTRPALFADIPNVVDVKAGGMHTLCLTKSGVIYSFGCNDEGALGRDSEKQPEYRPSKIDLEGKVVKISAGDSHSACLLEDGKVLAWGSFRDAHGSMGLTTEGNKKTPIQVAPEIIAADIASGNDHLVILARNGVVYTIGCAEQGQLGRVTARTLTGESRSGTKTLLTPGKVPKKAGNFIANAIWATPFCTFLRENKSGLIYGFGLNNYNQLGVAKKGGKEFEHFPVPSKFENVKNIAGGLHHTIVLTEDNKVHAIGRKDYGRLGLGDISTDIDELTTIQNLSDIADISCGEANSFAITKSGQLYVWGMGTNSQLGTGDEDDVSEPKLLVSAQVKEKNILSVNGGGQHSVFLVEAPVAASKSEKAPKETEVPATQSTTPSVDSSEAAAKENGPVSKPVGRGSKKRPIEAPVIMASDSTTDVNGNSEKDEKMDVDAVKRVRKRKAKD